MHIMWHLVGQVDLLEFIIGEKNSSLHNFRNGKTEIQKIIIYIVRYSEKFSIFASENSEKCIVVTQKGTI